MPSWSTCQELNMPSHNQPILLTIFILINVHQVVLSFGYEITLIKLKPKGNSILTCQLQSRPVTIQVATIHMTVEN